MDRPSRAFLVTTAALGIGLGLAAEQAATRFQDPETWVPDLAFGWTFVACGLIAWHRRPESRSGLLMVATGAAWFLPNFGFASFTPLAWIAERTLYMYRGPLIHLLLTFPTGRVTSTWIRAAVALGYLAAITQIWQSDPVSSVLALVLVAAGVLDYRRSIGLTRRARLVALRFQTFAALVLVAGAVARIAVPNGEAVDPSHAAFEISFCVLAVAMLVALVTAPWERTTVTDLVVETGEARSDALRDALANALGDPSLEVGYRVPGSTALVDARGRPFVAPEPESQRAVTTVRHGNQEVAVLVHDRALLDDPGLMEAVSTAAQLAASNARLQAEVRARVEELDASRRRLLEAGDEERRRLERRLNEAAEKRLEALATTIERAKADASGSHIREQLSTVETQLSHTLEDLRRLGHGLHPRELTELGLVGALHVLASRAPLEVSVQVDTAAVPDQVEGAAYYVCAEALTNIAKHAGATAAAVSVVSSGGHLTVDVTDDGEGGADARRGSGLRGLLDRIETLGGSLSIDSPVGQGTHLHVRIPMRSPGSFD